MIHQGENLYFLKHHFDPYFDHTVLKPEQQADGSVNHHELDYVQNVEAGDVLAEWVQVDEQEAEGLDSRFVYKEKKFPASHGTGILKQNSDQLLAAVNGYVYYANGKITVGELLRVHRDVDYNTGNIKFVANLNVEGGVRTGFRIQGRDVNVDGLVEGARVEALGNLNCRGGVKGNGEAFLEAGKDIKLAFCENSILKAGNDILIKGSVLHSEVYAGRRLAVGGRLMGGRILCKDYIYVGEQLGGGMGTDTRIILGYHPTLLFKDQELSKRISELFEQIERYKKQISKGEDFAAEFTPKLDKAKADLKLSKAIRAGLWGGIQATQNLDQCKVLVPGKVKPGVEISIGSAFLKVDEFFEDVYFYHKDGEVRIGASTRDLKS